MYNIYVCIHRCKVRACKWVRVCVLAYACDRVRALTMREYAACVRVRRALFVRPSIDRTRTGIAYRYIYTSCLHLYPCTSGCTDERITDAGPPHARPRAASVRACVRVRLGAHVSAPTRASAFRRRRPWVARLAGVQVVGVQRQHRIVECTACYHLHFWVRRRRPCGLHQARRVRKLGVDAAHRVPDVELAVLSMRDTDAHCHTKVSHLAWGHRDMGLRLLLWDALIDEWGACQGRVE
jgi:hypothetical protein